MFSVEIDGSIGDCDVQKEPNSKKRYTTFLLFSALIPLKGKGLGFGDEFPVMIMWLLMFFS